MQFCTDCGTQNPDAARFCSQCGHPLVDSAGPSEGESQVESTATIVIGASSGSGDAAVTGRADTGDVARVETGERLLNPADSAAVDALPEGHALLVVQRGPSAGSRFLLDKDLVHAGRHPESEIFLDDVTVSRRHAEFRRTANGFQVGDVGSLNGTYVNRDRIDAVELQDSDEVQIGKYRLVFFAGHTAPNA